MTTSGTLGLGVLHFFELPWLVLGVWELIRRKINYKKIIIAWILLGLLPASFANNEQSSGRSLLILPAIIIVLGIGALKFFQILKNFKSVYIRIGSFCLYIFFMIIFFIHAYLTFGVYFPNQKGEAFMEGTKETILFILQNKDKYNEVVYDPYRGIEAQYIVNIPYMYFLFYSKFDPGTFQKIPKSSGEEYFSFDKFTTRRIDWRVDRNKKGTLFVGSPWSLPEKDLKEGEILQKIYLSSKDLAFLIVSPR